jgi:two-component system phosphate regulon sensor histidine kinase PhoR
VAPFEGSPDRGDAAGRVFGRRTLARRLLAYTAGLVGLLAVLAIPLDRGLESTFLQDLTDSLTTTAKAVRAALPAEAGALQDAARRLGGESGVWITVIGADGVVLADSERDPAATVSRASPPEVRAALAGRVGVASRRSDTAGLPSRYVALPLKDGRIVRVARPLGVVGARLGRIRLLVGVGFGIALVLGLLAAWLVSRRLTRPLAAMTAAAAATAEGNLDARVPEEGTAELALLGAAVNRMATELRARIEEATEDRRTRDLVLAAMDEGVLLVDDAGLVQYANPAALRLVGRIAAEQHSGTNHTGRPYLPPALRTLVGEARRAGSVRETEIEIGHPARTVLASAFPVGGEGLALLVLRDVTEARRVDAIRRDFVAAASHELKTPVASIQAAAETLTHALDEDPEAARRFVGNLLRDAERLSRIVMDLLDLSRLESERAQFESVRLDTLARDEIDRTGERTREAGLDVSVTAEPVTVSGSRKDLALLFSNLLDNAFRYTKPGGTVRVEVSGSNGHARIAVSDSGIGIPARDLPRIFERFYRVDRARSRDTGGTGLGLAIVKHIAEQHGGRVEAKSELGRGSTFVVTLPVSQEQFAQS